MVRTDHEDGGVLNPDSGNAKMGNAKMGDAKMGDGAKSDGTKSDGTRGDGKKSEQVRKTSPLSRRRKAAAGDSSSAAPKPDEAVAAKPAEALAPEIDEAVATEAQAETSGASEVDPAKLEIERDADDSTRPVSYRARRTAGTASSAPALSKGVVLPALAAAVTAVLLIAGIVCTIIFSVQSSKITDARELRTSYDQFAQEVVVRMTTLNKENADNLLKFAEEKTSGRAQQQFRESMKQAAELIRADDMKTTTTILASAVEKADADAGSVLVVFAWEASAPEAPEQPDVQSFRTRVDITRINGELKMTNFDWVS